MQKGISVLVKIRGCKLGSLVITVTYGLKNIRCLNDNFKYGKPIAPKT
jgi:hypothetical protein